AAPACRQERGRAGRGAPTCGAPASAAPRSSQGGRGSGGAVSSFAHLVGSRRAAGLTRLLGERLDLLVLGRVRRPRELAGGTRELADLCSWPVGEELAGDPLERLALQRLVAVIVCP